MYVFGGLALDGNKSGDLTAFKLSTRRWTAFQDTGPSPCGRWAHAMASDGRRVFVLGGKLSPGTQVDETKLIHVLDMKHLDYPEPDSDVVNPSEKTTQLVRKSSASPPIRGRPHQPSSSSSDIHAAHGASPFRKAPPEELDHPTSQQIAREQNPSLNGLPSRPTGASEHQGKLVAPDAPSRKEIARLEHGRLIELERQLSETLFAKTDLG
ncbi:hypothetical protein F5888DRAFT_117257 [Russula emetica]|nr:hypothetical protein F5888DRAFT_117257 [Russula emetica]